MEDAKKVESDSTQVSGKSKHNHSKKGIDPTDKNNVTGPDYLQPESSKKPGDDAAGAGCQGNPMVDEYDKLAVGIIGCNPEAALQKSKEDLARVTQEITAEKIKQITEEMGGAAAAQAARDTKDKVKFDKDVIVQKYFPERPLGMGDGPLPGEGGPPPPIAAGAAGGPPPPMVAGAAPPALAITAGAAPAAPVPLAAAVAAPVAAAAPPAPPAAAALAGEAPAAAVAVAAAEGVEGAGETLAGPAADALAGGAVEDQNFEDLMTAAGLDGNHNGSGSGSYALESDADIMGDLKPKLEQIAKESVETGGKEPNVGGSGSDAGSAPAAEF